MAITFSGPDILMTAAGDQITEALFVDNIRFVGGATTTAGDIVLVNPSDTTKELYRFRSTGASYSEAEQMSKRYWPQGVRLHTFSVTAGIVYITRSGMP